MLCDHNRTGVRLLGWPAAAAARGPGGRADLRACLVARPAACYGDCMARASITCTDQTAAAIRAARPTIGWVLGKMVSWDDCLAYLLEYWLQNAPEARHLREAAAAAAPPAARPARRKSAAGG